MRVALVVSTLVILGSILASGQRAENLGQMYPDKAKFWMYASPRIELKQTGEPARVQSPDCGEPGKMVDAAVVVTKTGAKALDKYLETQGIPTVGGYGVTQLLLDQVDNQGNRAWLGDRLGINAGQSSCASQCVIYPTSEASKLSIHGCLSETGNDGLDCGGDGWNGQWMGAFHMTHSKSADGRTTISCMSGKNWSHNRNRWFFVVASEVNPLSGSPMNPVYRGNK